jgi:bifunctional UDP-N-acetylglucosamine pyrophosphorylase/glucosamine-1-phosphate N-acetyltransferase/UDP-N-acetylglucosamine pyrophosphorylase
MCREHIAQHKIVQHDGPVLIVTGDSPLAQASSLRRLLAEFAASKPACLLGTATKDDPTGLGRIVRDADGEFVAIVEEKDAIPEQLAIREVNMSTYLFDARHLLAALEQLTTENAQGEYYVTDCPGILKQAGQPVAALCTLQPCEALSINTLKDLAIVEAEMRRSY